MRATHPIICRDIEQYTADVELCADYLARGHPDTEAYWRKRRDASQVVVDALNALRNIINEGASVGT